MIEMTGDIWVQKGWIGITTNGTVTPEGRLIMGAGQALQAKKLYPDLPKFFGQLITERGNQIYFNPKHGVFNFPTKEYWRDLSTVEIVDRSCKQLYDWMTEESHFYIADKREKRDPPNVFLVPPGCGLGGLDYQSQVRPVLVKYFEHLPLYIVDNK